MMHSRMAQVRIHTPKTVKNLLVPKCSHWSTHLLRGTPDFQELHHKLSGAGWFLKLSMQCFFSDQYFFSYFKNDSCYL